MLDLNHPQTKHVFAASNLEDSILTQAKRMTLIPSDQRLELFAECHNVFGKMRKLNSEHFKNSTFISIAIDELEQSLRRLAQLNDGLITEDRSSGEGCCPACGETITNFVAVPSRPESRSIYCSSCLKIIIPALSKLRSDAGFGTDWI
jgi:hypothetical protein